MRSGTAQSTQRHALVILLLAPTPITGWGMIGALPMPAGEIAAEFGAALPTIFLGSSVMLVTMGAASPWAGRPLRRFCARQVLAIGVKLIGLGLCILALSPTPPGFFYNSLQGCIMAGILATTNQIPDERGTALSIIETITDDREITVGADLAALQRDLQPVDCRDA